MSCGASLSSTTESAAARLSHSSFRYELVGSDKMADNWDDLLDGTLDVPFNRDERGLIVASLEVWTGTAADGSATASNCTNWTSGQGTVLGSIGRTDSITSTWTDAAAVMCNASRRLYCIEQ